MSSLSATGADLIAARAGRRLRARPPCRTVAQMKRRRSYAAAEADYTRELQELARLRDEGVITAEDFNRKKQQLLGI